ncbi:lytic transglycosylase domain-containing protein [Nocardioides pacificus]
MNKPRFGRVQRATALVPLALLSAAWTASLASVGGISTASAGIEADPRLPDGTSVPTEAIEAPASVSLPGVVAPAVPTGKATSVVATAWTNGIPAAALAAYQRAETVINSADKGCNLTWQLVAAIGRVESDHGRFGGNSLDDDGIAKPGIFGIALDGTRNTAEILDTDAGQLDNDMKYDRAIGPMQFIPSTWSVVGVDADGDGKRNPQDIDDAALATAVYLCSGNDDLSTTAGQRDSVYRYNHSDDYVDLVLSIMEAYSEGDFTSVPNSTTSAAMFVPETAAPSRPARGKKPARQPNGGGGTTVGAEQPSQPQQPSQPAPQQPLPTAPDPTKPAKPKPTDPGLPPIIKDPGQVITDPGQAVEDTLTWAEARAQCLAKGLTTLDLAALTRCITDMLAP